MKIQQKIEKKGYKVQANMGYINGEQTIVSYTAKKVSNNIAFATAKSMTALYRML